MYKPLLVTKIDI
jgi:hypothetical protein